MRLAPGGSPIALPALMRILSAADPAHGLTTALATRFPGRALRFHASGREAMRVAVTELAARTGRREIAIPAYGCFSIPASVVAAGLRVRLVDVDDDGRLSAVALETLPYERVAAVVVGNLFGVPEATAGLVRRASAAGTAVVDDAAQALGASAPDGRAGDRGDVGILSFGRGKPLSALGGGASLWRTPPIPPSGADDPAGLGPARRSLAVVKAIAYTVSRHPAILDLLSRIPALEIGKTIFEPSFTPGSMSGAAVALAAALVAELDAQGEARREVALAIGGELRRRTAFRPLLEEPSARGVYPRLGIVAPSRSQRDAALARLVPFGATAMYPTPIEDIRELKPHRTDDTACPGARHFCDHLITLPTHAGLWPRHAEAVLRVLVECS